MIHDEIGGWFGARARDLISEVKDSGGQPDLSVRIHSPGGSFFEGLALYNWLRQYDGRVTTIVDGIAASAATLPFLAGDERQIPRSAYLMLHAPWAAVAGNGDDLRAEADLLDHSRRVYAELVARHMTDGDVEAADNLLDGDGTYLDGMEAISLGLADTVIEGAEPKACLQEWADELGLPDSVLIEARTRKLEPTREPPPQPAPDPTPDPEREKMAAEIGKLQAEVAQHRHIEALRWADQLVEVGCIAPGARDEWAADWVEDRPKAEQRASGLVKHPLPTDPPTPWEPKVVESGGDGGPGYEVARVALYRQAKREAEQLAGRALTKDEIGELTVQVDQTLPPIEDSGLAAQ